MSEDLSKLTERDIQLLILQELRAVARSLEGVAQSVGRDVATIANDVAELRIENTRDHGEVTRRLGALDANIEMQRQELHAVQGVVRGVDFLASQRVETLEGRVDTLERRPRVITGGGG